MRRTNQTIISIISAALDAVLTFLTYLLAAELRFIVFDGVVSVAVNSLWFQAMA